MTAPTRHFLALTPLRGWNRDRLRLWRACFDGGAGGAPAGHTPLSGPHRTCDMGRGETPARLADLERKKLIPSRFYRVFAKTFTFGPRWYGKSE